MVSYAFFILKKINLAIGKPQHLTFYCGSQKV